MEQQRDWTRAPPPSIVPDDPVAPRFTPKPPPKSSRPPASAVLGENMPTEISIDEEADLAELAKKIEQRTR